jgi:hypothetical protein
MFGAMVTNVRAVPHYRVCNPTLLFLFFQQRTELVELTASAYLQACTLGG